MPAHPAPARDEFLSVLGAARRRQTSQYAVLCAIARGELRTTQVSGRIVVRADDVERWTPARNTAASA